MLQARTWLPRAEGTLRVAFKARAAATALAELHQAGCARARFPNPQEGGAGAQAQAIILNMAGGLTGGDRFDVGIDVGAGASATVSTAAAEKIYRARDADAAVLRATLSAGAGSTLLWLPQPTILFDRSAFDRTTTVALARDATFLAAECLIFGRAAMGEDVTRGSVRDRWRVEIEGKLVYADTFALDGPIGAALDRPAVLAGHRAVATILLAAPGAVARLDEVRTLLDGTTSLVGASVMNGILLLRAIAKDGRTLQSDLRPAIEALSGRRLPRIWQC